MAFASHSLAPSLNGRRGWVRLYRYCPRGISMAGRWYETVEAALTVTRFLIDGELMTLDIEPSVARTLAEPAPGGRTSSRKTYRLPQHLVRRARPARVSRAPRRRMPTGNNVRRRGNS